MYFSRILKWSPFIALTLFNLSAILNAARADEGGMSGGGGDPTEQEFVITANKGKPRRYPYFMRSQKAWRKEASNPRATERTKATFIPDNAKIAVNSKSETKYLYSPNKPEST
jgi:hypothetical protein